MTDEAPDWDERTFLSLAGLIGIGTKVSTLATAIEDKGIQGWDRFGRFKTFTKDSKGEEAAAYSGAMDALAMQYQWESNEDNQQATKQSPADSAGYSSPFQFGWFDNEAPDFSAIVVVAAKQPMQPKKQAQLSELGKQGADVKHAGTRALKEWARAKAKPMKGHPRDIARQLAAMLPAHLAHVSKDPLRLINEAIK